MAGKVPGDPVVIPFPRPAGMSNQGWDVFQDRAKELAVSLTPHRNGALRGAWELRPGARQLQLTNDLDYADYVDKGTLEGKYIRGNDGTGGMAPRGYSDKIMNQLSALAGQLMQQYPATAGGTNRAQLPGRLAAGAEQGREFHYGPASQWPSSFADLGRGFGQGENEGDWGANISVNHPEVEAALRGLTGPARQRAFTQLLAGSHRPRH